MSTLPSCSDYSNSIVVSSLVKAPMLSSGSPETYNGRPVKYAGGFCIVFPYISGNGMKYAVRCWHAYLDGAKERTRRISETLRRVNLPYFVKFEYVENGIATSQGLQSIVVMDWVNAKPLKAYISENLYNPSSLNTLANNFASMVRELHENNLSHGDLQHGNIMVKDDGSLVLVDYDSMYVPALDGFTDEISGLAGYQHPARWNNKNLSPKADYFSELVIYTSIKALAERPSMWKDLNIEDSDTLIFSVDDINSCGNAHIFNVLESIPPCAELCVVMKKFLSCKSIDELKPLEDVATSYLDKLSDKWKDNGYTAPSVYQQSEIEQITNKW